MRHLRRRSTLLRGEGEYARTLNFGLSKETAKLFKFCITLAGQAGDKARAEYNAGDTLTKFFKELADIVARATAVHRFKYIVIYVLNGNI